ncbi:hypothetical protein ACF0H5_009476 [Mactra antiquata]
MNTKTDQDDMEEADLGLGDGLKPGALPITTSQTSTQNFELLFSKVGGDSDETCNFGHNCTDDDSDDDFELTLMPIRQIQALKSQYTKLLPKSSRSSEVNANNDDNLIYDERYFSGKTDCTSCHGNCENSVECDKCNENLEKSSFPSYADVQYGTSIRQQKELFNQQMEDLRKKMNVTLATPQTVNKDFKGQQYKSRKKTSCEEIAMKLAETLQEVEELKAELEACEQKLDSKYKAIDILRKQAEEAQSQLKFTEKISKENTIKLSQEIVDLQYNLECRDTTLMDTQQIWACRYDL